MSKWLGWLVKVTASAAIMAVVSVFTTWLSIQAVIDKAAEQFGFSSTNELIEFSDVVAQFTSNWGDNDGERRLNQEQSPLDDLLASRHHNKEGVKEDREKDEDHAQIGGVDRQPEIIDEETVPVWSSQSGHSQAGQERITISIEEFEEKKDALSDTEKMKVFSILFAKVPADDLQILSGLIEGGLTSEELEQAEALLSQHLEEEEYLELLSILDR